MNNDNLTVGYVRPITSTRIIENIQPPKFSAIKGVEVQINIQPWFTTLTSELSKALIACIKDGMPINVAEDLIKDALRNAITEAVLVGEPF